MNYFTIQTGILPSGIPITGTSYYFYKRKVGISTWFRQRRRKLQAEAAGLKLRPHSAKDTLTFLHKHFVKENSDQFIIRWMMILRHTRDPGVSLYEWCNSFGPLIRTYLRTSDVDYLGIRNYTGSTSASLHRSLISSRPS